LSNIVRARRTGHRGQGFRQHERTTQRSAGGCRGASDQAKRNGKAGWRGGGVAEWWRGEEGERWNRGEVSWLRAGTVRMRGNAHWLPLLHGPLPWPGFRMFIAFHQHGKWVTLSGCCDGAMVR
jgi:hypothetical protein